MRVDVPRLVIAAPASGCGKTTVAVGLMAALAAGHRVQGFKVGPDYIDPGYHTAATGRVSRNLDTWLVPIAEARASFARATAGAEIAVIEGVMGLFDGYDAASESGSTAEVAKLLGAPVVLVLDVGMMARSAGALALGYRAYDPQLAVAGVICNQVAGAQHARWVTQAIEDVGLPVVGCIPRTEALSIPERHLGLHMAVERPVELGGFLRHAAETVAREVDLERLWEIARAAVPFELDLALAPVPREPLQVVRAPAKQAQDHLVRIAVARDEAFCFYYEDNLDLLREAGAEIAFFSPLSDASLPAGSGGLYLGGGYPELYAAQLAANTGLCAELRAAHAAGMPIYAECGGLMYLTQGIVDLDGVRHPMAGLLPGYSRLCEQLVMGYRTVTAQRNSLLLRRGEAVRGHEFHYSVWLDHPADAPFAYELAPRQGEAPRLEGYAEGNLLASYVHLHFAAQPAGAHRLVRACREWLAARPGRAG